MKKFWLISGSRLMTLPDDGSGRSAEKNSPQRRGEKKQEKLLRVFGLMHVLKDNSCFYSIFSSASLCVLCGEFFKWFCERKSVHPSFQTM